MHDYNANSPQAHWSDLDGESDPHVAFAPEIRHYPETSTPPEVVRLADGGLLLTLDTGEGQEVGVHLGDVVAVLVLRDESIIGRLLTAIARGLRCTARDFLGEDLWRDAATAAGGHWAECVEPRTDG